MSSIGHVCAFFFFGGGGGGLGSKQSQEEIKHVSLAIVWLFARSGGFMMFHSHPTLNT